MSVPVYSAQLLSVHGATLPLHETNNTGDLIIVRTVTVFYGGATADTWSMSDEFGTTMLQFAVGTLPTDDNTRGNVWEVLHLCWNPHATWLFTASNAWDFTLHGYQLSLP